MVSINQVSELSGISSPVRRLAAIVAIDVVGFSRLMEVAEEETLERLKAYRRELIDPKVDQYRGRIFKTTGDGALMEFRSVVDAVRFAVDVQREMAERNSGISRAREVRRRRRQLRRRVGVPSDRPWP